MTRYTNLGYKRTYVEATKLDDSAAPAAVGDAEGGTASADLDVPKKKKTHRAGKKWTQKRKREAGEGGVGIEGEEGEKAAGAEGKEVEAERPTKKRKMSGDGAAGTASTDAANAVNEESAPNAAPAANEAPSATGQKTKAKAKKKIERNKFQKDAKSRALASEERRLSRIADRQSSTICFACRQPGHSVKDCPTATSSHPTAGKVALKGEAICYRCGSTQHTLGRCRKPELSGGELPFAKCFVCGGTGHLAGQCGKNERGVYPRGGSCKVCGEVTHLAKDCPLRSRDSAGDALVLGISAAAGGAATGGGDEDDFHLLNRRKAEVALAESAGVGSKHSTGTATTGKAKKVVKF